MVIGPNALGNPVFFSCNRHHLQPMFDRKMIRGTPMNIVQHNLKSPTTLTSPDGEFQTCPTIMTEEELIRFLRIPEISSASNHRNVIENLKRKHGLPRIYLCGRAVYPTDSVKKWLQSHVTCGQ
jgi:hypothetical protein